jgi:lipoprotein-anchoring transpeptidase ErfK/SrfK
MTRIQGFSLLLLAVLTLAGCHSLDRRFRDGTQYLGGFHRGQQNAGRAPHDDVSYWDGDGVRGAPTIRINLAEQRAYFYKGGELVGISTISTGREGFNTPMGRFRIQQKDKDHTSSIYGDYIDAQTGEIIQKEIDRSKDPMPRGAKFDGARMPYFMRITGGVGMHQGFLPGYAASHGCIRMPGFMAERFFDSISVGTPVSIAD